MSAETTALLAAAEEADRRFGQHMRTWLVSCPGEADLPTYLADLLTEARAAMGAFIVRRETEREAAT